MLVQYSLGAYLERQMSPQGPNRHDVYLYTPVSFQCCMDNVFDFRIESYTDCYKSSLTKDMALAACILQTQLASTPQPSFREDYNTHDV
mgnify:CR=1 FL=1